MDGALEAVEDVPLPRRDDLEGEVIIVSGGDARSSRSPTPGDGPRDEEVNTPSAGHGGEEPIHRVSGDLTARAVETDQLETVRGPRE